MRNTLPELCCSVLPSTGELIIIKSGERGYYQSEWNTDSREENQKIADFTNSRLGITPAELEAMICGSMNGWDAPGAQPQFYLDLASREKSTEITGHLMHPCLSSCYPIKGYLHTYRIMGKAVYYIDFISMPKSLMEERFGYIYSPDLVNGKPMMPVTYHQSQNGTYTLRLVDGSFHQSKMEHAGYAIMASVMVGGREIAIGFDWDAPAKYSVWERIPNHPSSSAHEFHNGSYHKQYAEAMKNCETRITTAYIKHCRKPYKKRHKSNKHIDKER